MDSHLDVDLVRTAPHRALLILRGVVDLVTVPLLRERLAEARADGLLSVELDLAGLRFIDSSGLGALIEAEAAFPRGLALTGAAGLVQRVLETAATAPPLNAGERRLAWAFAPTGMLSN